MLAMKQKLITLTLSAGVLEVRCLNHPQRQRALRLEGHVSCRLQLLAALKLTAGLPGEGALLLETPPPRPVAQGPQPIPPPPCTGSRLHHCGKAVLTNSSNGDLDSSGLGLFPPLLSLLQRCLGCRSLRFSHTCCSPPSRSQRFQGKLSRTPTPMLASAPQRT